MIKRNAPGVFEYTLADLSEGAIEEISNHILEHLKDSTEVELNASAYDDDVGPADLKICLCDFTVNTTIIRQKPLLELLEDLFIDLSDGDFDDDYRDTKFRFDRIISNLTDAITLAKKYQDIAQKKED